MGITNNMYMEMATIVSSASYCERRKVGAIIVRDNQIISEGYNGTPAGFPNVCETELSDGSLKTNSNVLHAESNAITKCAKNGNSTDGAKIFVTTCPCIDCAKLIIQSGITEVYYRDTYKNTDGIDILLEAGINVKKLSDIKLVKTVNSKVDKVTKLVYTLNNQLVEVSYVDNGTNKDILCVPTMTMCNAMCSFCSLTPLVGKIKANKLTSDEISDLIEMAFTDAKKLGLIKHHQLLISFMGTGDIMYNTKNVLEGAAKFSEIYELNESKSKTVRFAASTILPTSVNLTDDLLELCNLVNKHKIRLKLHLSLHNTDDVERKKKMPSAHNIGVSLSFLEEYHLHTDNPVEVHYTLIDGWNSSRKAIRELPDLFILNMPTTYESLTVKFMKLNGDESKVVDEETVNLFIDYLKRDFITAEYYVSPGDDINSSCGQFITGA